MRVVIVVVIVDRGPWRVVVAVMVAVGRRTVLMFRMCVSLVRVYMLRRRGRQSGHRQRQHERQESVHEDESTTRARTSVKSDSPERDGWPLPSGQRPERSLTTARAIDMPLRETGRDPVQWTG